MTAHNEMALLLTRAAAIVREDHDRLNRTMRDGICNRADIDFDLELDDARKSLVEAFRLRFYPEASRVVAAPDAVFVVSPQGLRVRRVFDAASS